MILENITYVKRVVFPLEILPYVVLFSSAFHTAMSLVVLRSTCNRIQGQAGSGRYRQTEALNRSGTRKEASCFTAAGTE